MHLTAHPSVMQNPIEGPAELVEIWAFTWTGDYSWLRTMTCRNHPTAVYYTKNWWDRHLHLVQTPVDLPPFTECDCPVCDLVVVVGPDSQEQRDMIAGRLAAHKQLGCDPKQLVFEGTYGAPGIGQAWRCTYCDKSWSNIGGTFIAEDQGAHLLTIEDVR